MIRSFSEGIQTKTNKQANRGFSPPRFLTYRRPCERCNYCTMKILKDKRGICILHQCLNEAYFIVPNICSMKNKHCGYHGPCELHGSRRLFGHCGRHGLVRAALVNFWKAGPCLCQLHLFSKIYVRSRSCWFYH